MASELRTVAEGLYFGEGPRWHDGRLWFSDFYAHRVCSVSEAGGDIRVELEFDDQPSGLGWMPDGSLLVVSMVRQQVWRRWPDGRLERHADLSDIAGFWCNDMVVDGEGRAYVGNFGFDLDAVLLDKGPDWVRENGETTSLALIQPDGTVSLAAGEEKLFFPNGPVITPDGKTFIVGETLAGKLTAFDIEADGHLSNRREWASTDPRLPDGICLDAEGAIWIANPLAPECVRYAQGGEVLEVVETGELNCYACMLGGADGKTLFMVVAPTSHRDFASAERKGKIIACKVDVARAGRP
ncbi:SMP-30/gluconolactonase/LRE family protein [Pseudoblastomonas halimionae]|uniref:Gluconolactonase n=1 Tax=Alteriqipengyuania halimionae TaxID=1926630 RepID=A0A6I4U0X7_9SPHN|nr:SMP-30/gluconolactonase/LRE family protein [Alteriqipengyuania halimionae]MXP08603.1 gluconolactonase [Alteriqipengyuania halimionae]